MHEFNVRCCHVMANKALFLDRDGVINYDTNYLHKIDEFHFLPGIFDSLKYIQNLGYLLIVVTNQSGIGRGIYTEEEFLLLDQWMHEQFRRQGVFLTKTYYCPHHPVEAKGKYLVTCDCRKPKPGMILAASDEYGIDLSKSILVGDKPTDYQAARVAGIARIFGFAEERDGDDCAPDLLFDKWEVIPKLIRT